MVKFIYCILFISFSANTWLVKGNENLEKSTTVNLPSYEERGNITKILGIELNNNLQEICIPLDAPLILENKTTCFKYELSNVTNNLLNFYIETFERNNFVELPNLHYFANKIPEFYNIDYYLFLKCIYVLLEKIEEDELGYFIGIVEEVMNQDFKNRYVYLLAKKLFRILYEIQTDFVMSSDNLMLASWIPSTKNISGFLFYKNATIEEIVKDENIEILELSNVELGGYISPELLKQLRENVEYSNLRIKMIFIIDAENFKDILNISVNNVKNLIGISIPGFCKTDNFTILTSYFGSLPKKFDWTSFGQYYIDSTTNIASKHCILDELSFFGPKINQISFYESVKDIYCLPAVLNGLKYEQTRIGQTAYPQQFCVNDKLNIPAATCRNNSSFLLLDQNTDCLEIAESNITKILYKTLNNCTTNSICDVDKFLNYTADDLKVFIDIKLYFDIFIYLKLNEASAEEVQRLCQVFGRGITLFENQNRTDFLDILVLYFLHSLPKNFVNDMLLQPNYIYQKVLDLPSCNETRGIAILQGNDAISIKNAKNLRKFAKDYSTNAVIYILGDNQTSNVSEGTFLTINIVVLHNYHLSKDDKFGCNSVIVALHHNSRQHERIKFAIFLKNFNDLNNGYWGLVESERKTVKFVCLRQSNKNKDIELIVFNRGTFNILHTWNASSVSKMNCCIILYVETLLNLFLLNWIIF